MRTEFTTEVGVWLGVIIEALREESVSSCLRCWGVREDGLVKLTIKYVDPHLSTLRERH